jgi:hypothetical protein
LGKRIAGTGGGHDWRVCTGAEVTGVDRGSGERGEPRRAVVLALNLGTQAWLSSYSLLPLGHALLVFFVNRMHVVGSAMVYSWLQQHVTLARPFNVNIHSLSKNDQ